MSQKSLFTINSHDAAKMVRLQRTKADDDNKKQCYLIQVTFSPLYSDSEIPNSCFRKLPRLVNGIPLGAGLMSKDQLETIRWRYVEGSRTTQTFISNPMYQEEAEGDKRSLRERLIKLAPVIFGDVTVRATVVLSQCLNYDEDLVVNDIAVSLDEGLRFRD
ncbi:uncharacterized protein LOC121380052 [Gigantopelta aegis]|uniref:uncharacterized protein LOC121380052 n=1 Tax=Gigantopelta aegis TaxID=1735272 RepID=UPI001B88AAD4|nr:uncharacterized protein LOC121380052 [Gigantopelta aegis]